MSKEFYLYKGKTETWPNLTNIHPGSLTYDDILLVPQVSHIESRRQVDTSVKLGPYTLKKPIIAAPMDTISGETMIRTLGKLGALGTLPRGNTDDPEHLERRIDICRRLSKENIPCMYAVSLKNGYSEAEELQKCGAKLIVVDIAHGGSIHAMKLAKRIKDELSMHVVLGNIVTYLELQEFKKYNIDIAKVGVGPGGLCTTRLVAGTGFPQLSAIFETIGEDIPIIADGGVKQPGDFAKAIAAGATAVMLGSYFAATIETPGEVTNGKKLVRGQASASYMNDNGIITDEFRAEEGTSVLLRLRGSVVDKVNDLMGGLRSAMSYAGASNIEEFQEKAQFCPVSNSALREGTPWIKNHF